MRLFAAVDVPEEHKDSVELAVEPMKAVIPGARWTARPAWHVTLKFFGEVPEAGLGAIRAGLRRALAGAGAVDSRLLGIGAFPNLRRARVLWAGIEDSQLELASLAERIGAECGYGGDRALHPHLTLARFKAPAAIEGLIDRLRPFELDPTPFTIDRVILFRSFTERSGARYEVLDEWGFSTGRSL